MRYDTPEELISPSHLVRIVNEVINKLNIESLLKAHHIRGSSSYHHQLLLKVLVYGYVTNIYSSRKLAAACQKSIYFMWLSSMSYPDYAPWSEKVGIEWSLPAIAQNLRKRHLKRLFLTCFSSEIISHRKIEPK